MMNRPTVHVVGGPIGAGKTTYAKKLAAEVSGVVFSIDDWMKTLFSADSPSPIDPSWMWERVGRCEKQIADLTLQILETGKPVILDLGFQRAQHRIDAAKRYRDAGFDTRLDWLDVDANERWKRVQSRNEGQDSTFQFTISRQMFDFIEASVEAPLPAEYSALDRFEQLSC